jgi:hypothetical protein
MFTSHYPITTDYQNWLYMYTILSLEYIHTNSDWNKDKNKSSIAYMYIWLWYKYLLYNWCNSFQFYYYLSEWLFFYPQESSFSPTVYHMVTFRILLKPNTKFTFDEMMMISVYLFSTRPHELKMLSIYAEYNSKWGGVPLELYSIKDLYSRKDMNLARFNIDCMQVCCVARTSDITHSAIRWRCTCLD